MSDDVLGNTLNELIGKLKNQDTPIKQALALINSIKTQINLTVFYIILAQIRREVVLAEVRRHVSQHQLLEGIQINQEVQPRLEENVSQEYARVLRRGVTILPLMSVTM